MMRVAYIIGGLPFGGVEKWLYDLSLEYMRNGLVHGRVFNLSGAGELLPKYRDAGIDVECILNGNLRGLSIHRLDTTLRLRERLKAFAPDLIHTMHFAADHHGRLAALGLGLPVVTHVRNIKHERRLARRIANKLLSFATSRYLAVSGAVAEVVQSDHNMAKRPVQVLYNAINPDRLDGWEPVDFKAAFGLEGPVALAVSRYVSQKNLHLLVQAVRILLDRGRGLSLVLVGEGPERGRLEKLRDDLGLQRHVALTGFRQDVPAFLKAAYIFVMPSDFEGLPVAHLEAMHCGLPAVVSPYVPSLEIARDAALVCRLDAEDIADKLASLLEDRDLYARLSAAARQAAAPLRMANYAKNLHGVYEETLGDIAPQKQ